MSTKTGNSRMRWRGSRAAGLTLGLLAAVLSACSDDSSNGGEPDGGDAHVPGRADGAVDAGMDGTAPRADAEPPPDVPQGPYESDHILVYPVDPMERIVDTNRPSPSEALEWSTNRLLSIYAAPGQSEPATFVVYPKDGDLTGVSVSVSDFQGRGGKSLAAAIADPYLVKCWYALHCSDIFGCGPNAPKEYWPELLVRDDGILTVDHDSKTNRFSFTDLPTIPDSLQPFDVAADGIKEVWVRVSVPADAEPGYYVATVTVAAGQERVELPLVLEVVDVALARGLDDIGVYTVGWVADEGLDFLETMVSDLAQHGINMPYIMSPVRDVQTQQDQAALLDVLEVYARHGLLERRAILSGTRIEQLLWNAGSGETLDPELEQELADVAQRFHDFLALHYPKVTFYTYGVDEQAGNKRAYQVCAEHGIPVFNASNNMNDQLHYRVRFTGMWWIFAEWAYQIYVAHGNSDSFWRSGIYVMGSFARDPVMYRLRAGFWLWDNPTDGYVPWVLFDSLDRDAWDQATTWYFVRPATNGLIDTLQWEGYHQGAVDGQYVSTLAMIVEKARESGISDSLIDQADALLQYVDIGDFNDIQAISANDINSFAEDYPREKLSAARRQIKDLILQIQAAHPELHSRNLVGDEDLAERAFRHQLERTPLITRPYPYGVQGWEDLRDTFLGYYNQHDFDAARPYAQQLKDILDEKQREFQQAPKPDWEGNYITPLEWWLLRMEVWDQIQEVLNG